MGTVTQTNWQVPATGLAKVWHQFTSTSNKVGGKVDRSQQSPCLLNHNVERRRTDFGNPGAVGIELAGAASHEITLEWADFNGLEQRALAKFNGKLRKGSASLGVTMASWGQSSDMIVRRLDQVASLLGRRVKQLEKIPKKRRPYAEQALASNVLEVEFGWRPLFSDLHAAMYTVCQDGIPPAWLVGRHKESVNKTMPRFIINSSRYKTEAFLGSVGCTVAANVTISNPNLWLLNRLGLINPLGAAWDLIPWSFLVGAFVNVNAMINSLSNEVGLTITHKSVTKRAIILHTLGEFRTIADGDFQGFHGQETQTLVKQRARAVGNLPTVQWQVRVPEVSFETALILSSLVVQRASKISALLR